MHSTAVKFASPLTTAKYSTPVFDILLVRHPVNSGIHFRHIISSEFSVFYAPPVIGEGIKQ